MMRIIQLVLSEMACSSCIGKIKKGISKYNGVEKVNIITGSGKLEINYNEKIIQPEELMQKINKLAIRIFD